MRFVLTMPALVLLFLQADCASNSPAPPVAGGSSCISEAAQFQVAVQQIQPIVAGIAQADYGPALRRLAPDVAASRIARDVAQLDSSIDLVNGLYGGLRSCRIAAAASLRAAGATRDRLRAERSAYTKDLNDLRSVANAASGAANVVQKTAEQVEAASPAGRLKAAKALAAPPPALEPYVAIATAGIHAKPDIASPQIAELRRGLRALGPGEDTVAGWTTITLNDGSLGYVETDLLRPAATNASAALAAGRSNAARDMSDPYVALAIATERVLPSRISLLTSTIETANDAGATAYGG